MLKIHVIKSNVCSLTNVYVYYKHTSLRIKTLGLGMGFSAVVSLYNLHKVNWSHTCCWHSDNACCS
jgi:hypothetical protein